MAAAQLDAIWIVICAVLVLLMQAGFACLESGMIRAKNSVSVAVKNLIDVCVAGAAFWSVGFGFMFGASQAGLIGLSGFAFDSEVPFDLAFFFFQLVFCGTAVTIVSGAVAERMRFAGYLAVTLLLSVAIYPVVGHWAWGGLIGDGPGGWLARVGFLDFAGSTVVHSVGGWLALAAVLVIGPRQGRFGTKGRRIDGHDLSISMLGVMLLWVGWFGFNAGSTLAISDAIPGIVVNTALAPVAGGLAAMALSWRRDATPRAEVVMNGVLAGLVAVTASCNLVAPSAALMIGAVGGGVCVAASRLLERLRVDDAVGAVPVHLAAGIWGTLAVALFGDTAAFAGDAGRLEQLGVQALGVAAAGAYAFGLGFPLLWLIDRRVALRVSGRTERIGLNVGEHGANSALNTLLGEMDQQRRGGDFTRPVAVEEQTEAGLIAARYNQVLDRIRIETDKREQARKEAAAARDEAEHANRAKSAFLASMSHELRTPLNAVIGFSDIMQTEAFGPLGHERYRGYVGDINASANHLLSLINDLLDLSKIEANKYELHEEEVEVAELLSRCQRLTAGLTQGRGQQLELSDPAAGFVLRADQRVLRQVVLNLISNASKYTPVDGRIVLAAGIEIDGRFAIQVRDDGPGMSRQEIRRALEPFGQGDAPQDARVAEDHRGTGLGLPLTKQLMELHGGSLVIQSEKGRGTCVVLRFPAWRVNAGGSDAALNA